MKRLTLLLFAAIAAPCAAEESLHERIDRAIQAGFTAAKVQPAPLASDAEFLRRVYLDLIGLPPTSEEARNFLGEAAPDKRKQLIEQLLARPDHARHLQQVFDVLLMERRRDQHVPAAAWREYLRTSFAERKPWDTLVKEILSADGTDPKTRPAAKFVLDREAEPNLVTRDVGRMFLGVNLQCAQCHDHPQIEDYKQDHYYGLFAFFQRTSLFADAAAKQSVLAEKADGETTYQSVFDPKKTTKTTGPRLLDAPAVTEPKFDKGQEYAVAPAKGARPVPKFSRRAQLAPQLVRVETVAFRRNIANRLWGMLLGRGLVHPLDLTHGENPPSHPELLDLLAEEIGRRGFVLDELLREIALSQTYQRSSELSAGMQPPPADRFAVALLKPLTPEQLAWSLLQATGRLAVERKALGAKATEPTLHDKLVGQVTPFINTFGNGPGQPEEGFQATLDQALFLANGKLIRDWLQPREGNLTARLLALKNDQALAEELYLSTLTRLPTPEERQEVADWLKNAAAERPRAVSELAWALLASAEFRFNH